MTQHFEDFTIQQFRGLRDLSLLGLGKINLFVGANNSGKTSVLEALSIYSDALNPSSWIRASQRREIRSSGLAWSDFEAMRWLFPQSGLNTGELYDSVISMVNRGSFGVESVSASYKVLMDEEFLEADSSDEVDAAGDERDIIFDDEYLQVDIPRRRAEIEIMVSIRGKRQLNPTRFHVSEDKPLSVNERRYGSVSKIRVATITPISHWIDRLQISTLSSVILGQGRQEVIDVVRQIDPRIRSVEIISR